MEVVGCPFPTGCLVPKSETGVTNFLQKYPEFDGRDTVIAIFDSGVDPLSTGLQNIYDGSVKVIERFDCSGCGDTDVSYKVTADANGCITGLSERLLKLTPQMMAANNANGEYRVGLKSVWDLYPKKIHEATMNLQKSNLWDEHHKTTAAELTRKLAEFDDDNADLSKMSWDKKLEKENLESALDFLNSHEKTYMDLKLAFDVVLYSTDKGWQAVIDTTQKGDLENALHIGEYSKTHELKTLDHHLSISINVHDEGNVLEIVGMCSPHGTHVASIASGNHENKDLNGIAPNAKIVAITIGDGRMGAMETGTALVRGIIKVMELCERGPKVDVINMSYGEHASWSNTGRLGELIGEVVNKYGVVWVVSAGNHGPALSTIGSPPDVSQPCCIGVGAYVSPQMMEAEYALREKLPGNVFTWTSRDPCIDGGQGVTICAPGAAITSVPQFSLCKSQLMNGTSMSAPHVAGAVALLISGLKQKGIPYSPFSIKRAICASATKLTYVDPFAQGSGLLNVEKAFEHLLQHQAGPENLIRFSVLVSPTNTKGIYLREGILKKYYEYSVAVVPRFLNEKEADPKDKCNFNLRLNLVSSQPFAQCGAYLDLCYSMRSFPVKIDPIGLAPGVHHAVISAYDNNAIDKGPLFQVPITVIQPIVLESEQSSFIYKNLTPMEFQPNTIQRDFIFVPHGATWAVLKLRLTDDNSGKKSAGKFFIHTMQLLPMSSCRKMETMKLVHVSVDNDSLLQFSVKESNILELCIAKYWSNLGVTHLNYSVEFHGISTSSRAGLMHSAIGIHQFEVTALGSEEFQPSAQLKYSGIVLKPTDTKISPLSSSRDMIPQGRQIYQNVLTYTLSLSKQHEITIFAPLFSPFLYESEFESQFWILFDSNKMMITCGDANSHMYWSKLEKGDYTIRLQIRHERKELLEKISEANMIALVKLQNPISLDFYDHYNQAIVAGRKFSNCIVRQNPKVVYIAPITNEKLAKASFPSGSSWLSGVLTFTKDEVNRKANSLMFRYFLSDGLSTSKKSNGATSGGTTSGVSITNGGGDSVPSTSPGGGNGNSKTNSGNASPKKSKVGKDDYLEALRDFQCSMISKLDLEKAEELCNSVLAAHPKHMPAILAYVQNLENTRIKPLFPFAFTKFVKESDQDSKSNTIANTTSTLATIIEKTNVVVKETDKDALLAYFGIKNDNRPDAAKIKTNMEKQKSNLLEALSKKGIAIAKLNIIENGTQKLARAEEIDGIYLEIVKYAETTDSKIANFLLWHAHAHSHYGRMMKQLSKILDDKKTRDVYEEMIQVALAAEWDHLVHVLDTFAVSGYPKDYRLF